MKDFFKYVLATVVGLLLFGIVIAVLGAMSVVGMVASTQATQSVSDNSVLVLNLNGSLEEQSTQDYMSMLTGDGAQSKGLAETLEAIKKAKDNDRVKGIYLEAGSLSADIAQLQEIRTALADFRKAGKWVVSYADTYSQGTYYLASVADKVYMNPLGMLDWHGLGAETMYVKDALAKVGVKMQVVKVGKYKSATEMYTEDHMSEANREQTEAYLTGLWNQICKDVSASRKISVEKLNQIADSTTAFRDAKELVSLRLIDGLIYAEQVKTEVRKLLKIDEDASINQLSVADMQGVKADSKGEEVAVYYAFGGIVQQEAQGYLMGGGHSIVGDDVCRDLEDLMNDDNVKAVVIRVNSPGGDAYASEQINHQVQKLKAAKPVVVSMGGYAASGGYYISAPASYIMAEPTTITGSIGIFGTFPDRSELMTKKLGLKYDEVKTNQHATFGTASRPFNAQELALLQGYIDRGYETFVSRVATGRKLSVEKVKEIAQGHVYTGEKALALKLVDELGGLDQAVAKASALAGLKDYHTANYPAQPDLLDQLLETTSSRGNNLDAKLREMLGEQYEAVRLMYEASSMSPVQARMPVILNIR